MYATTHTIQEEINTMRCSMCKEEGHTKRTCTYSAPDPTPDPVSPTKKRKIRIIHKETASESIPDKIHAHIMTIENPKIILLRIKEVVQWLFGDLSFLPPITKKNKTADEKTLKALEDTWGQTTLRIRRPDLKLDKQWTNKFGEHICEELFILRGKEVSKPVKKEHYQPDVEVDDAIIEAKAQTYYTSGTAGEKILGCPFKYAEIPTLYEKPLYILCMGGAEQLCRVQYGNLPGAKCSPQKQRFLDFFKENRIEYIGATDILTALLSS